MRRGCSEGRRVRREGKEGVDDREGCDRGGWKQNRGNGEWSAYHHGSLRVGLHCQSKPLLSFLCKGIDYWNYG